MPGQARLPASKSGSPSRQFRFSEFLRNQVDRWGGLRDSLGSQEAAKMSVVIELEVPQEILDSARITPAEAVAELAVALYAERCLNAKRLAM